MTLTENDSLDRLDMWDEYGNDGMRYMEECDVSGGETDCYPVVAPMVSMTPGEIRAILNNPHGLRLLMDYDDMQYSQSASMCDPDEIEPWPTRRFIALRERGREVMAEDPDLWDTDIKRAFGIETPNPDYKPLPDGVKLVDKGRYIGSVVDLKEGYVIQDEGKGSLVAHDASKFEVPPKVGDKMDIKYVDGIMKVLDALSKDNHAVNFSINTR